MDNLTFLPFRPYGLVLSLSLTAVLAFTSGGGAATPIEMPLLPADTQRPVTADFFNAPSAAGDLDASFGGYGQNGRVLNDWNASGTIRDAAVLPDGSAIVVGTDGQDIVVARYDADGQLDPGFGDNGSVSVPFGSPAIAHAVAIYPDGKILIGGAVGNGAARDFALARLNPDSTPDNSFDDDGLVTLDFNGRSDSVFALTFLPGNDILAVGGVEEAGAFCFPTCNSNFGMARFDDDGELDSSLAGTGMLQLDLGGSEVALAVTFDSGGGFYAVGSRFGAPAQYVIARYNAVGNPATGFGGTGVITGTALARLVDVELLVSNAIVALGEVNGDVGLIRYNENGTLVSDFGTNGLKLFDFGGSDNAGTLLRLSDSTLVVAGSSDQRLALAQFTDEGDDIPGSLALTDLTDLGALSGVVDALSVSLVREVRLWTIGTVRTNQGPFLPMTRHFLNGAADNGGRQATDYDPDGIGPADSNDERASAAAFQSNGMLLVAGATNFASSTAAFLTRYTADGALDPELGAGGMLTVDPFLGGAVDLAVQADGRILVAGPDFDVVRLFTTGTHDLFFNGGYANANWVDAQSNAMALQSDGKPVLAGGRIGTSGRPTFALARFSVSGVLDPDFGNGGKVLTSIGLLSEARAVALQADGKIIAAGLSTDSLIDPLRMDFTLVRYLPNGSLDMSFDDDGKVTTDFGSYDGAVAVLVQPDGKIVAAGESVDQGMAFARYLPNGAPDTSFSGDGKLLLPITGAETVQDLAVDGSNVFAAVCDEDAASGMVLRLTAAGELDNGFNGNGQAPFAFAGHDCPYALAARSGRIAAAGYAQHPPAAANPTFDLSADFAVAVYESGVHNLYLPLVSR
jgi:uncharacterized delta-60 repeat protein